jgi:hypothetical protein
MRITVRCGVSSAAIIATALLVAAPASASRASCDRAANGHGVIAESTRGLVFKGPHRLVGCSYAGGRLSVLPGQGQFRMDVNGQSQSGNSVIDPAGVHIAGRYVAYGAHWTEKTSHPNPKLGPPTTERVISFDLQAGARKYASTPNDDYGVELEDLVVKADGAVAWIYSISGIPGLYTTRRVVVKMDRASGGSEHGLDADSDSPAPDTEYRYKIVLGSLALSFDRKRIYWMATQQGDPKPHHLSAPLD